MDYRVFNPATDYEEVCGWWRDHKWDPAPLAVLPPTGIIVSDNGTNICAGWLYTTGTALGHFEWIVANPNAGLKQRYNGIRSLTKAITEMAEGVGLSAIFTSVRQKGLIKMLQKYGFGVTDNDMTNMMWVGGKK